MLVQKVPFSVIAYKLDNSEVSTLWGMQGATFDKLLPASSYFAQHPEWYAERNGKRVNSGELCLEQSRSRKQVRDLLALRIQANQSHLLVCHTRSCP